ncbi:MAG TPA: hypothetical protein VJB66_03610 [Candidatus Nanoarchaeia archaeon]|nr:hypothetical protein [Candidatus Nanoarchaeia archaeon]
MTVVDLYVAETTTVDSRPLSHDALRHELLHLSPQRQLYITVAVDFAPVVYFAHFNQEDARRERDATLSNRAWNSMLYVTLDVVAVTPAELERDRVVLPRSANLRVDGFERRLVYEALVRDMVHY